MPSPHPAVLAVINPKGGAGKTTTAAHVAHALHERGLAVTAVDADPQQSLWSWHEASPFPFRVGLLPSKRLHLEIPGYAGGRYDVVVIDTPGTEHGRPIVMSALLAATHVLIPMAPTPVEAERLPAVRELLDDATPLRPGGRAPALGVLLVRVRSGALSGTAYRDVLTAQGWPVLHGHVALLERFALAHGGPVLDAARSGYADAAAELLGA